MVGIWPNWPWKCFQQQLILCSKSVPKEDSTRPIAAHRRPNWTYCCSQKAHLDILLLTEDSSRHIAAHRRLNSTYCCSQKSQLDILLLTEDSSRHIAAHRRPNWTYCCSQKTHLDILLVTEGSTRHIAAHGTQFNILLLTEDSARHTTAHRRLSWTYCCSQKTQLDILLLTEDSAGHIAAHRRLSSTYYCTQKTVPFAAHIAPLPILEELRESWTPPRGHLLDFTSKKERDELTVWKVWVTVPLSANSNVHSLSPCFFTNTEVLAFSDV